MQFSFHALFDIIAYSTGIITYFIIGKFFNENERPPLYNIIVVLGALIFGGLFARIIPELEDGLIQPFSNIIKSIQEGGKSIAGGFLGGILGVKIVKLIIPKNLYQSNDLNIGDQIILPFTLAFIIGRIGCFLSGVHDNTHGKPTNTQWGFDYGDFTLRHPVQLYEIAGIILLAAFLLIFWKKITPYGLRFRIFVFFFFLNRFIIEFYGIHPTPYWGMSIYQICCIVGMIWSFFLFSPSSYNKPKRFA